MNHEATGTRPKNNTGDRGRGEIMIEDVFKYNGPVKKQIQAQSACPIFSMHHQTQRIKTTPLRRFFLMSIGTFDHDIRKSLS